MSYVQSHYKASNCQSQTSNYFFIAQHTIRFLLGNEFEYGNFYDIDCHLAINKSGLILLTHSTTNFYFFLLTSITRQIKLIRKLSFCQDPFPELSISDTNQIRFLKFMKKSLNEEFIAAHGEGKICIWSQDEQQKWNVKIICQVDDIRQVYQSPCERIILIKGLKSFNSFFLTRSQNDKWEISPQYVYLETRNYEKQSDCQIIFVDALLLQQDYFQIEFITNKIFLCINHSDLKLYKFNSESKQIEQCSQTLISQKDIILQFNQQRQIFAIKMEKSVLLLSFDQNNQLQFEIHQILFYEDIVFSMSNNGEFVVKVFGFEKNNQLKFGKLRI